MIKHFHHKFFKFLVHWSTFSQVFEPTLHCKLKLVCITWDRIHPVSIGTFFVEMIFFKIFFVHWRSIFNGIWSNLFQLSFRYQFLLRQMKRSEKEEIGVQNFKLCHMILTVLMKKLMVDQFIVSNFFYHNLLFDAWKNFSFGSKKFLRTEGLLNVEQSLILIEPVLLNFPKKSLLENYFFDKFCLFWLTI